MENFFKRVLEGDKTGSDISGQDTGPTSPVVPLVRALPGGTRRLEPSCDIGISGDGVTFPSLPMKKKIVEREKSNSMLEMVK